MVWLLIRAPISIYVSKSSIILSHIVQELIGPERGGCNFKSMAYT